MKKILVTGASGFIGSAVCQTLMNSKKSVRAIVRLPNTRTSKSDIEYISVGDMRFIKNWKEILTDVDCVIHCAGRAHVIKEKEKNPLKIFREINVEVTRRLAESCIESGVRRFIFLSSIGVNGNNTNGREPFSNKDDPNPKEDYAISKFEAEKVLLNLSKQSNLQTVIIRPPLVYGPNAKGNFFRLLKLIDLNIPLPFSSIKNNRSMIGLDNLVDVILKCIEYPVVKSDIFLVSDGEDISTPNLIKLMALSMNKRVTLFYIPMFVIRILCSVIGRTKELNQLAGFLEIDISYTKKKLNWTPSISLNESMSRIVKKNDTYI